MDHIKDVGTIISVIMSAVTLIVLIAGYLRNLAKLKEGMKAMLRDCIETYYYQNYENKSLREYERKNLDSLYGAYHDGLKGNSFAEDLYEQMRDWKIVR